MAEVAFKNWELENDIRLVDPTRDALYNYSSAEQRAFADAKPWKRDANHFTRVRISAVALLKMVMHARSGGSIEVMGLMQGSVQNDTFIVTDAFRLPVEGTETRVNAQEEANEYAVSFMEKAREAGQMENAVGWYHSHPGYGCWLSGIDVATQHTMQMGQDPFLAVVIDPDRTISAGKVEIGAFRTYPEDYTKPAAAGASSSDSASQAGGAVTTTDDGFQTIPLGKMEDFGAHASRYYSLEVSHFKSTLDAKLLSALWNKSWVGTLSSSPLFSNRDYGTNQILDLAHKIRRAEKRQLASGGSSGGGGGTAVAGSASASGSSGVAAAGSGGAGPTPRKGFSLPSDAADPLAAMGSRAQREKELEKVVKASDKIAAEERAGLLAARIKDRAFNVAAVRDGGL